MNGTNNVVELRANEARTEASLASARELLAIEDPYPNHNGGQLAFAPDGLLYHGTGDGGAGGDPENRAQDLGDQLGKLLRLDVDDPGAEWEVAAYGLRNPWRFSFDRETGDLWLGDVGQGSQEEIDFLAWPLPGLVNFGWDVVRGDGGLRGQGAERRRQARRAGAHVRARRRLLGHGWVPSIAATSVPAAQGRYFFGDYCSGTVWSLARDGDEASDVREEPFTVDELSSFGEGLDGELYAVSLGGTIYRLAS